MLPGPCCAGALRPDVLHNTYYFPIKPPTGTRGILTVYDMIHEKYPKYFAASPFISRIKAASVAAADHVICISESTRRDLLTIYDIPEERVSVTHLGFDPLRSLLTGESSGDFRARILGADAPYLLFVGSRVNYKNFQGLLDAYAASASLRMNCFLLCFGGGDFTGAERVAISKAGVEGRVRYLGGSDAILAACYAHASLFVCPSLYEGFGIPVLEAMSLECPVACSNSSSLPEVVGDAAKLFDPLNRDSVRDALESVLESPSAAAALRERGRVSQAAVFMAEGAENTMSKSIAASPVLFAHETVEIHGIGPIEFSCSHLTSNSAKRRPLCVASQPSFSRTFFGSSRLTDMSSGRSNDSSIVT